jgi:hypothetical protein
MTTYRCLVCGEPVATEFDDRCGDCRETESRIYADWSESEGMTDDVWLDAQSVNQAIPVDIAEAPTREEVDAEDARLSTAPFMTEDFAEYAVWRREMAVRTTPISVPSQSPHQTKVRVADGPNVEISAAERPVSGVQLQAYIFDHTEPIVGTGYGATR